MTAAVRAVLAAAMLWGAPTAAAKPRPPAIPLPIRITDRPPPQQPPPPPPPPPDYVPPTTLDPGRPPRLLTARSLSGFCWDVPPDYAGNGTRQRSHPDDLTPTCQSLGRARGF